MSNCPLSIVPVLASCSTSVLNVPQHGHRQEEENWIVVTGEVSTPPKFDGWVRRKRRTSSKHDKIVQRSTCRWCQTGSFQRSAALSTISRFVAFGATLALHDLLSARFCHWFLWESQKFGRRLHPVRSLQEGHQGRTQFRSFRMKRTNNPFPPRGPSHRTKALTIVITTFFNCF